MKSEAREHHDRKRLNRLVPPLATDEKVLDSKRRKIVIEAEHFAPGVMAAMNKTLNAVLATLNKLAATVIDSNTDLSALSRQCDSETARNSNRSCVRTNRDAAVCPIQCRKPAPHLVSWHELGSNYGPSYLLSVLATPKGSTACCSSMGLVSTT